MTTWCSMSPIFLPSFHHAIHHTSGVSPRSTVLLQRTRSSKSIFQTFSTALIFIEIYRILKRSTSIDNFYRIIQTGHKTYRNFNKISIYLATVTPSLNFFIASPITPLHFALFPIIWTPDRMVHAAPLHPHAPQLSKSIFKPLSTTTIFYWNLQCFETHCLPATSFTTSTPSFQKNIWIY